VALLVAGAPARLPGRCPAAGGSPGRAIEIGALTRTVRLRNFGSWTNDDYDDIAWFGLAVQPAAPLARRSARSALPAITTRLQSGWTPGGGGGI
jgi:predicted alpha-1,6-mannanase (GH76 family)